MNILYIILKHVIWRFQIYNLFCEIFKFREDKSNNVFREIRKCFRKTAKFEFFAKQIIYLESPDDPLQNDYINMFVFQEFGIFSNFRKWPKFRLFRENCS